MRHQEDLIRRPVFRTMAVFALRKERWPGIRTLQ